jgi:hypothetical protein
VEPLLAPTSSSIALGVLLLTNSGLARSMRPRSAPPEVQDQVAKAYIGDILRRAGGDVSKVPLEWYTGNIYGHISASAMATNKGLTPGAYQRGWMHDYAKLSHENLASTHVHPNHGRVGTIRPHRVPVLKHDPIQANLYIDGRQVYSSVIGHAVRDTAHSKQAPYFNGLRHYAGPDRQVNTA